MVSLLFVFLVIPAIAFVIMRATHNDELEPDFSDYHEMLHRTKRLELENEGQAFTRCECDDEVEDKKLLESAKKSNKHACCRCDKITGVLYSLGDTWYCKPCAGIIRVPVLTPTHQHARLSP